MKKCNNWQTVALNDADECCRECWEDKFTEIDELPEADKVSKSAIERFVSCQHIMCKRCVPDSLYGRDYAKPGTGHGDPKTGACLERN